ncbi:MAG: hypothetical protein JWM74_4356 [Myxococcaceae bacterium]|nr:hypothetical protein [Myxococcaceae bacterium]
MSTFEAPVLLTVRGTLAPTTLEAARVVHNETAGSERGIQAARSLGDLSHNVYSPSLRSKQSGAKAGELLFLDTWESPVGLQEFFSNPAVHEQASKLFTAKDATVWMPARASSSYQLPAPSAKHERFVGVIRGAIKSPESALATFASVDRKTMRDARRRGQISHQLYIKLAAPGDASPLEILGVDVWHSFEGMTEHYSDQTHMSELGAVFAAPPQASVWEVAPGTWSEW